MTYQCDDGVRTRRADVLRDARQVGIARQRIGRDRRVRQLELTNQDLGRLRRGASGATVGWTSWSVTGGARSV